MILFGYEAERRGRPPWSMPAAGREWAASPSCGAAAARAPGNAPRSIAPRTAPRCRFLRVARPVPAMQAREREGREAQPTAGVIADGENHGGGGVERLRCRKKIDLPRARHAVATPPGCRTGGASPTPRHACPWLRHLFADGGYAGRNCAALDRIGKWTLEIVKRSDTARRLPRGGGGLRSPPPTGSSNAPLHGSGAADGWPGKNPSREASPPISDSQPGGSQGRRLEGVSSQALRA